MRALAAMKNMRDMQADIGTLYSRIVELEEMAARDASLCFELGEENKNFKHEAIILSQRLRESEDALETAKAQGPSEYKMSAAYKVKLMATKAQGAAEVEATQDDLIDTNILRFLKMIKRQELYMDDDFSFMFVNPSNMPAEIVAVARSSSHP